MSTVCIQPGETIFVTGVNGLIGSYIVDELLKRGYHVRGAVRDVDKSKWLLDLFEGTGKLDLVSVPDMTVEGCYDDVVKGTSGFIHVASPLSGTDPEVTIPIGIKSAVNALSAAAKTRSITRVVYTSSSIAATFPSPGVVKMLDQSSWNDEGVRLGWKDQPPHVKGINLYAALKTESEKACWAWIKEHKPHFVFNSILPNVNFSRVLAPSHQGAPSTIAWARTAWTGEHLETLAQTVSPQFYISTPDTALLHIAALLAPTIANERIYGFAETWDFNQLLAIYRKHYPEQSFPSDFSELIKDLSQPPSARAEEILKTIKEGGKGWDDLESKVVEMAGQFAKGEV